MWSCWRHQPRFPIPSPTFSAPAPGARQLIEAAVIAEFDEYLAAFDDQNSRTAAGAWFATVTFPSDRSSPGSARLTSGYRKRAAARARRRRSAPRWCRRTYGLL